MKAPLYSQEGKKKSEVVLNPAIYGATVNARLLALVQNAYAGNLRRGTAHTKTRKEKRGGGKKPWRQKGTGRARAGSTRSPIWRGGGTVFGPRSTRNYSVALPLKMKNVAMVSALSKKADAKKITVLESAKVESPKTKDWAGIVKGLPLEGRKTLCVVKEIDDNLRRASRNLREWVQVKTVKSFNAYDVLQRDRLVIDQEALPLIDERFQEAVKS